MSSLLLTYRFSFCTAMMYTYYAFRAMQYRIPLSLQIMVTICQLSQMIVGCFVNYKAFIYKESGVSCNVAYSNIFWSFVMYAVYFLLLSLIHI